VLPVASMDVSPVVGSLGGRESSTADLRVTATLDRVPSVDDRGDFQRDLSIWSAVVAVAGARAALGLTLEYVAERKVFGRPVAEFENTRFRLAELAAELAAAEALTDMCVSALTDGTLSEPRAAAALLTSAQVHDRAVDQGMQLHGGYGYMREYPISHAFSDARFLRMASAATDEPRRTLASALGL
jgi:acyl-CoA dehydrogenase